MAAAPNVTFVRVRAIIERVGALLARLVRAVEVLGALTFAAGLAILAGAIAAQTLRRRAEIAVLKALGATGRDVRTLLGVEFAVLGGVAAAAGGAGAFLAAHLFVDRVLELDPDLFWPALLLVVLAAAAATALVGLAASQKALRARPLETLRGR